MIQVFVSDDLFSCTKCIALIVNGGKHNRLGTAYPADVREVHQVSHSCACHNHTTHFQSFDRCIVKNSELEDLYNLLLTMKGGLLS